MNHPLPSQITFSSDVLFQALDDEAVLLDLASEKYLILNELGKRLWELLSENGDTSRAVEQLLLEYEVDRDTLRQDVADWIGRMIELGLACDQKG